MTHAASEDHHKWQLALEFSGIGVWEFDAIANQIHFSSGSKNIIGVTDPKFGSHRDAWNDRVHPDDRERYLSDFQNHLRGLVPMYENEHRVRCEDGSYKWIRDRGKIVEWDSHNNPKRIIGTHTDITKHKLNENIIHESLVLTTAHNNKLMNFAHIVTHNLKQHTANFESLMDFYEDASTAMEKKEIIIHLRSLSTSLSKTISNLHDVVNVQNSKTMKTTKIYVSDAIDHILKLLAIVITENNATIHNNIPKKLFLYYNYSYFESIIQNLLSNAIKYKHPERDPIISIDFMYDLNKFELSISDNGIGIDLEKYSNDIFGLYKTFHNNENAEGVGLYLIKNQIESYGGTITVASEVNVGTTFTITGKNRKV
ncbi:PAS domain S-box protein [Gelidibacter salicanalis]|uniref:histidine kinase n=1 Tax=Gelidibacter salicanalis TaxID=291193 RepID=A0A5C7AE35_9FLAO|nr:PAS domain-containing protein [Gelidibacter salicanalis]TXE06527.1 PAS domain S-box protein [Gelidibacter salicanalis]